MGAVTGEAQGGTRTGERVAVAHDVAHHREHGHAPMLDLHSPAAHEGLLAVFHVAKRIPDTGSLHISTKHVLHSHVHRCPVHASYQPISPFASTHAREGESIGARGEYAEGKQVWHMGRPVLRDSDQCGRCGPHGQARRPQLRQPEQGTRRVSSCRQRPPGEPPLQFFLVHGLMGRDTDFQRQQEHTTGTQR